MVQESPAQSAEAVSEGEMEEGNAGASTGDAAAHHQIEAISSGTERKFTSFCYFHYTGYKKH